MSCEKMYSNKYLKKINIEVAIISIYMTINWACVKFRVNRLTFNHVHTWQKANCCLNSPKVTDCVQTMRLDTRSMHRCWKTQILHLQNNAKTQRYLNLGELFALRDVAEAS